jgi:hypothetical protein
MTHTQKKTQHMRKKSDTLAKITHTDAKIVVDCVKSLSTLEVAERKILKGMDSTWFLWC